MMKVPLFVMAISMACVSCQSLLEPDPQVANVRITIRVTDKSNKGIPGIAIKFRQETIELLDPFGPGTTDGNGQAVAAVQIPITGARYVFSLGGITPDGCDTIEITDTMRIPCQDTVIVYSVVRHGCPISCDTVLADEVLGVTICTGMRTVCSNPVSFNSTCLPVIVNGMPANPAFAGADIYPELNGMRTQFPVTLSATSDVFNLCMNYQGQTSGITGTAGVRVDITTGGTTRKLYNVQLTGLTSCDSCVCPSVKAVRFPTAGEDTLCFDSVTSRTIALLPSLINTNSTCDLDVRVAGNPANRAIRIVSLNNGSTIVRPGATVGPLEVSISPIAPGFINETVDIVVRTRNSKGVTTICDTLRVSLHFRVLSPACPLTLDGNLIASQSPRRTDSMRATICFDTIRTLRLRNESTHCPLRILGASIIGANPDVSLFGIVGPTFPTSIAPDGSIDFTVKFMPTRDAFVTANRRTVYSAILLIRSQCGTDTLRLIGVVEDAFAVPARLFTVDCRDPAVQIALAVNPAMPFCDLRNNPTTIAACASSAGVSGPRTVKPGDLYLLKYKINDKCPFCALIWIEQIDDAGPTRACPQVQFRVCSPIP